MFTMSPVQYDGWTIHLAPLDDTGEIFDLPTRTVLIDPTGSTLEIAAAHAVAHLKLNHHIDVGGCEFTPAQCEEADDEADRILMGSTWQLVAQEMAEVA